MAHLQNSVQVRLQRLDQLRMFIENEVQCWNIYRIGGSALHGAILPNNSAPFLSLKKFLSLARVQIKRRQSSDARGVTPSSSSSSSCALSSIDAHSRVGHLYLPRSNRLYQIASPLRSQIIALIRSAGLPRNKYKSPDKALLPSAP